MKGPETETVVETDGKNGDISQSYEAGQLHANDGTLSSMRFENSDASIQTTDIPQLPDPPKIDSARYIALSIAAAISAVVYSIILFSLASPEISDIVQQKLGGDVPVINNTQVIVGLLVVLEYAFAEEIGRPEELDDQIDAVHRDEVAERASQSGGSDGVRHR